MIEREWNATDDGQAKSPNSICSSRSTARAASPLVAMGGLVLIWVLQEWASSIHSYKDSLITPWNPGIGILFAVTIREGILYRLALFVGVVCAEFVTRSAALGLPVTMVSAGIIAGAYTSAAGGRPQSFPNQRRTQSASRRPYPHSYRSGQRVRDAETFTEFQTLMFALTATALSV